MLIVAINPGHDGAMAVLDDRKLLFSVESEKDSYPRHHSLHPDHVLGVLEQVPGPPDVIAYGGWGKPGRHVLGHTNIGTGYAPVGVPDVALRPANFLGRPVQLFASSHERSHIAMAVGMAPRTDSLQHAVLVWEGTLGDFHLLDEDWSVQQKIPVMSEPGNRFAFLLGLADPAMPEVALYPRAEDAGKLMALASFANAADADAGIIDTVERIIDAPTFSPVPKPAFRDSPVYNAGVEPWRRRSPLPCSQSASSRSSPLRRSDTSRPASRSTYPGGCGLNCDWNAKWRELGHFSSVFVPPCANDSGSALGTAIDALLHFTGEPHIDWDVYSGLEFEWDRSPPGDGSNARWTRDAGGRDRQRPRGRLDSGTLGDRPAGAGNRSLLAEPFGAGTRDRLNEIKQREGYRPIAPAVGWRMQARSSTTAPRTRTCSTSEVRSEELGAVTHVDGSARAQTVTPEATSPSTTC